ncbi:MULTISPECIES: pheST operon leader peptide PheM [Bacteria]|uniref:pheST attenuator peptide n=2 Tax=Enterobacterales TaxID=91347 RepID=A0ABV1PHN9_9ENTR|nr:MULTISPECIES: pheST operon leader peptide PheM [Enterobacterales]EAA7242542.1 hypothetical protein [Salmonella enterica]ECJ5916687.1 pheST operon leader peptide PheM [Salmonella enterica subsp. salamae]WLI79088.1 pheST operon leader peptide PheM [Kosakonia sp. H02]HCM1829763.1 pheST operon leader peptide PheM [Salmonella enterica subsp. salamae serovar 48:z81:z39]EBP4572994.1 pheST operon leader peptide PheM [Salmonella enterica]
MNAALFRFFFYFST